MNTLHTPDIVSFRLIGQRFRMSMNEFNTTLGFDCQNTTCDFPVDFDTSTIYVELCDNPPNLYSATRSKDLYLRNPCLKYLHRLLAYTFYGRKDATNILTKTELYNLWRMVHRQKLNFGFWIATQVSSIITYHRPLNLGHVILLLAVNYTLVSELA